MKGLAELTAENDELVARAETKRKGSLRRLKQRIQNILTKYPLYGADRGDAVSDIGLAIEEWDAAERKRGAR